MRTPTLGCLIAVIAMAAPCHAQGGIDPTDLDLDGIPGVRAMPANPQPQIPSVQAGTGRILIDRSHGGNFNTSGFMNYLASQGWFIADHPSGGGPITAAVLAGFDILVTPTTRSGSLSYYSAAEVAAIQSHLSAGNGLWVLTDNGNTSGINTLAQAFGVTFYIDYIQDPTNNEGQLFWPTVHILMPHSITSGVDSYGYYLGCCLSVAAPASIVGRGDDDAYSLFCPAGSRPPTLAVWEAGGRAVFAGDITPLHPSYYPSALRPEEQLLLQNIANWLLGDSPTATTPTSWGAVKSIYR